MAYIVRSMSQGASTAIVSEENSSADPTETPPVGSNRAAWRFLRELPFLIVGALLVAVLIKSFLLQVFYIPTGSMLETLQIDDKVTVDKLAYRVGEPSRGDVIVFESESAPTESLAGKVTRNLRESFGQSDPGRHLIKRVVALPGETIEIRDNTVLIDGNPISEPYLAASLELGDFGPVEVPPDFFFVMGDNRRSSRDSRVFGAIERSRIVGRAFAIVWPPDSWSGL